MKYSIYILVVIFATSLISCGPKVLPTSISLSDSYIDVKLSHETTKAELQNLATELNTRYNIKFDYIGSTFFDNDRARDLNISIKLPNGASGSVNGMLAIIEYKYIAFEIDVTTMTPIFFGTREI
jgi:hypothetical protein